MTRSIEADVALKADAPLVHQHALEILVASRPGFFSRLANLRLRIIAADLSHHAESLDAVAGSEFVDDRIRLRE